MGARPEREGDSIGRQAQGKIKSKKHHQTDGNGKQESGSRMEAAAGRRMAWHGI